MSSIERKQKCVDKYPFPTGGSAVTFKFSEFLILDKNGGGGAPNIGGNDIEKIF